MRRPIALLLAAAGALTAVSSAHAADACPNAAFREGAGANLPECRAWEQVSPVAKNGASVSDGAVLTSGDRAVYASRASFADANSGPAIPVQASDRGAAGWLTRNVDPPVFTTSDPGSLYQEGTLALPGDASRAMLLSNRKLTPDAVERGSNFYVRDLGTHQYRLALSLPDEAQYRRLTAAGFADGQSYALTSDLRHFAFVSSLALLPGSNEDGSIYQIDDGRLRLASVLPDGRSARAQDRVGPAESRPYSADGRRLTMTLRLGDDRAGVLYQRVDGTSTVLISRSHRRGADRTAPVDTSASWSTEDGKTVDFVAAASPDPLTDESPTDSSPRLFRWNADGDRLQDLLVGVVPDDVPASVAGISQVSPDGRYVWFTSYAVLDPAADGAGQGLYVLDTAKSRLSFVAPADTSPPAFNRTGTHAAIDSARGLLTFDATGDSQVATCVTCGAPGTRSPVRLGGNPFSTALTRGLRPHPITDDGRVFFDTPERLVPQDVNDVVDVYGYVPGQGLSLITSGTGVYPASFAEVGPSGDDVFFSTRDALVAQDTDEFVDFYDARVGGGFASQQATPPAAPACQGDACRGPAPASSGNLRGTSAPATRSAPSFALRSPSAAARRSAARRGRLRVQVRTSVGGKLALRATAAIRRRSRTVASASRTTRSAGTTTVTLRLSKAARRKLRRSGALRMTVSASFSAVAGRQSRSLTLRRPSESGRGGRS